MRNIVLGSTTDLEWQERALCAQTDPEAFFPEPGITATDAKRVCRACPVRKECLEYALDNGEQFGVWGGVSERDRRLLARRRNAAQPTRQPTGQPGSAEPARRLTASESATRDQAIIDTYLATGTKNETSRVTGVPLTTVRRALNRHGITAA